MADSGRKLGRRELMKLGAAGLATSAASGCATAGAAKSGPAQAATALARGPERRKLGRTGLEVPLVSMGVMNADNPNLVRAALDGGMVMLDTAHLYQNGRNEEMVGEVLKGRRRDSYVLCTKILVSGLDRSTGLFSPETRPEEVAEKLDISLKRLGVEAVDVLYLHAMSTREGTRFEPVLKALEQVKTSGKARFVGVSTHKNEPDVIRAAVEAKLYDVVLTAYNFRQDHHLEVEKAAQEAAAAGLGVVVMKTQAGVFWDKEKEHPIDPKAALRWAVRHPWAHTAVPGFTTLEQLQLDLEVMREPAMTEADQKALEPAQVSGFYCQGCEQCRAPCKAGLPIPELMRSYMYAHAYRNREAAKALLVELDLPQNPCGDCGACAVRCAKGFDVRERVRDIVRLKEVPTEFLI